MPFVPSEVMECLFCTVSNPGSFQSGASRSSGPLMSVVDVVPMVVSVVDEVSVVDTVSVATVDSFAFSSFVSLS